jgi:hypothetical protein
MRDEPVSNSCGADGQGSHMSESARDLWAGYSVTDNSGGDTIAHSVSGTHGRHTTCSVSGNSRGGAGYYESDSSGTDGLGMYAGYVG